MPRTCHALLKTPHNYTNGRRRTPRKVCGIASSQVIYTQYRPLFVFVAVVTAASTDAYLPLLENFTNFSCIVTTAKEVSEFGAVTILFGLNRCLVCAGDWEEGRHRDAAEPDDDSGSDAFGDFEDMETGEQFGADGDAATTTALRAIQDASRARQDDKAAKKAAFDSEYDVGRVFSLHAVHILVSNVRLLGDTTFSPCHNARIACILDQSMWGKLSGISNLSLHYYLLKGTAI